MEFIKCENCNEGLCEYDIFSCRCEYVKIKDKCGVCQSSSYDCEVDGEFTIKCPFKRSNG